jgi:hypothetical protein
MPVNEENVGGRNCFSVRTLLYRINLLAGFADSLSDIVIVLRRRDDDDDATAVCVDALRNDIIELCVGG